MRARVLAGVATAALLAVMLVSPAAGAQSDTQAFCQARASLAASQSAGDSVGIEAAVAALAASAPADALAPAQRLADLFADRGPTSLQGKRAERALAAIDKSVIGGCGFPSLDVSGIDYEFQGLEGPIVAGPYVMRFTNDAPDEHHELVLVRVKPGVTLSTRSLLALSESQAASKVDGIADVFAKPGDTDTAVVFLDPARYVAACFVEVGTTSGAGDHDEHGGDEHGSGAAHHWREGMRAEFDVVGGA
jgi:hypothetical protein